jgi:hypothetical protein
MLQDLQGIPVPPHSQPCGPSQGPPGMVLTNPSGIGAEDASHGAALGFSRCFIDQALEPEPELLVELATPRD